MTPEQFYILHATAVRCAAEKTRVLVAGVVTALGSLFDKKILREFNDRLTQVSKGVEQFLAPDAEPRDGRRAAVERSMNELNKLAVLMG